MAPDVGVCLLRSIYVGGLDVLELDVTAGATTVRVRNDNATLHNDTKASPDLGLPWFDKEGGLYGVTFSTEGWTLPGARAHASLAPQLFCGWAWRLW